MNVKVIKQSKDSVTVELSPVQIEILRASLSKEGSHRRKSWKECSPSTPEELMYHMVMYDETKSVRDSVTDIVNKYKGWGVLS